MSVRLPIYLFLSVSIYLSIYLAGCLFVSVSPHFCLSLQLSVCLSLTAPEDKVVKVYEKGKRPNSDGCFVEEDNKMYPSGSVWHPYVQPFGYMKCIACTCVVSAEHVIPTTDYT